MCDRVAANAALFYWCGIDTPGFDRYAAVAWG